MQGYLQTPIMIFKDNLLTETVAEPLSEMNGLEKMRIK
jgi:hypothetical protein